MRWFLILDSTNWPVFFAVVLRGLLGVFFSPSTSGFREGAAIFILQAGRLRLRSVFMGFEVVLGSNSGMHFVSSDGLWAHHSKRLWVDCGPPFLFVVAPNY